LFYLLLLSGQNHAKNCSINLYFHKTCLAVGMELNLDSFITPKGVAGILLALAIVCSFTLTAAAIGQQLAAPYAGTS
jgi:hypothetical protein